MDIIDIMLARAMTPQGKTETYLLKAQQAAQKATAAEASATAAIQTVEDATDEIATAREEATALLEEAQEALETAQQAQINTLDTEDVDDEIKKLDVSTNLVEGMNANTYQVITTYPDNTLHTQNATKMYKSTGTNEDGTMTQKAITGALDTKADTATVNAALALKADIATAATKQYVDQKIANIPAGGGGGSGSGSINIGEDSSGHMVVVDENGNVIASDITETELIETLLHAGIYIARNSVGLDINYQGKTFTRTQEANGLNMGEDFDDYIMYGGRTRCNVTDDGTITAFYGDSNYKDDGSNGQVMIYQPKFYYQRIPVTTEYADPGKIIRRESLILSSEKQAGFKLHPIFITENGDELDYVLFSAYEGSIVDDKMTSIAGTKPVSNITITEAEAYAAARGNGWHITNMAAESANQMLEVVEFGTMNGQKALESGISSLVNVASNKNSSAITGSTASLGNTTGHAESTFHDNNGELIESNSVGQRSITYRGLENPWGNLWNFIGGVNILGDRIHSGGAPYICTNFNYTPATIGNNYEYIGFNLPSTSGWINAMGYGNEKYDWVFMPIECESNANSLLPVGDSLWVSSNATENKIALTGGDYSFGNNNGLFYYACDRSSLISVYNYGARMMFIPTKNSIYNTNINKWNTYMGG